MKKSVFMGLCLAAFTLTNTSAWAGDFTDSMSTGSELAGMGALSLVAAPILITGGAVGTASAATFGIVKLVGSAGESLTDLTLDTLNNTFLDGSNTTQVSCRKPCSVTVNVEQTKKEIPLVVRKDYVELNMKVAN